MSRRYFDHVHAELSVALGRSLSRYGLWLRIWEAGGDPEAMHARDACCFVETQLDALLRDEGASIGGRARRRLVRRLLDFAPDFPTPEEWMQRLDEASAG